jgi:hypothetical protein
MTPLSGLLCSCALAFTLGACSETDSEGATAGTPDSVTAELDPDDFAEVGADDPRVSEIFDLGVVGKTPDVIEQVLGLAEADPALPAVQLEAVSAMEFISKHLPAEAVAGCGRIMDFSEFPQVRARVAEGLEFIGGRPATDILLDHIQDDSAAVREAVADALEFLVEPSDFDRIRAAYEAEVDRGVKLELIELIENIDVDVRRLERAKQAAGEPT